LFWLGWPCQSHQLPLLSTRPYKEAFSDPATEIPVWSLC
jgi:hypothetical protein